MPVKAKSIDLEDLRKHFKLVNGELYRVTKTGNEKLLHSPNDKDKYHRVRYKHKLIKVHRIVYSLYYNTEIDNNLVIDHINGNKSDNRIENLRAITHRENLQNSYKHREGRHKGIDQMKNNKYRARIHYNGKTYTLGIYKDLEQAISKHNQAMSRIEFLESKLS